MSLNVISIVEAKFKRDGRLLSKTFLCRHPIKRELDILTHIMQLVKLLPDEQSILCFYDNESLWLLITNQGIFATDKNKITHIKFNEIIGTIAPFIDNPKFILEKSKGIDNVKVLKKDNSVMYLRVEKESYSLIDGIITFLISSQASVR
jgi:hypothetical protein